MSSSNSKYILKVGSLYEKLGDYDLVAEELGIKKESVRRAVRAYRSNPDNKQIDTDMNSTLRKLVQRYSPEELAQIADGHQLQIEKYNPIHNFEGETVRLGVLTDTHIGSKYTEEERIYEAFEKFEDAGIDMLLHCGDVTEGLSHRAGHVYECSEIGYQAQKEKAVNIFSKWNSSPIYMIDGNHDRWFIKSAGACIVKDICNELSDAHFIGHDIGQIELSTGVKVMLWHGEDGSSYSTSYRLQKIVESLSGGTKPNVLLCGHTHKQGYFFERNIHVISGGSIQKQTPWMRGKRLSAHVGFSIIELTVNIDSVSRLKYEWFPFYC
jgi:predicted phosphodiesterase